MKQTILIFMLFGTMEVVAQNVGINNSDPKAKLDISGDLILKSADLTLADGNTSALDVNTNKYNHYKLIGPTGNFQIGGIAAGENDRIITLYNRTGHSLEVYNDDINADVTNRILTGTGGTFAVYSGGSVTLKYDNTINKWEITASHYNSLDNFGSGNWTLNGNDIYNSNAGNIGIGVLVPTEKLDILGHVNIAGEIKTNGTGGQVGDILKSNGNGSMQWAAMTTSNENIGFGSWGCDMQNLSEYNPIFASDGLPLDGFGNDAKIDGDIAIIGAKNSKIDNKESQGAAYIFKLTNNVWVEQQKLIASDGMANDFFGTSVSLSGNWIVIGAPKADINGMVDKGAAYLYYFDGVSWIEHAKFIDPNGNTNDQYAYDVDIYQEQLAISVIGNNFDEGAVQTFVFNGTTWIFQQLVVPNDNINGYNFGSSISINSDHLVIGVPASSNLNLNDGTVYFFKFEGNEWVQINKFSFPVTAQNDQFGKSVSLYENSAIVGSLQDKIQFFQYSNDLWKSSNNYTQVGSSCVSISNGVAITSVGNILKYTNNLWYKFEKVSDPKDTSSGALFSTVAIDNDRFVICAPSALAYRGMAIFGKIK